MSEKNAYNVYALLLFENPEDKKKLKRTEAGKKMFLRLYELAKEAEDEPIIAFCEAIV